MSEITIQGISKTFGDTRVLNDISFCAKDGNLLSLLGPSGCGKQRFCASLPGWSMPTAVRSMSASAISRPFR